MLCWAARVQRGCTDGVIMPPECVDGAGHHFNATVRRIQAGEFAVTVPPEPGICRECGPQTVRRPEGVIEAETG